MRLPSAPLEDWLRDYYFAAEIDLGSSGVEPYAMRELYELTGLSHEALADIVLEDGYSLGTPSLRAAIARLWGDGDVDKVMTANGSGEAIALMLDATLSPGDEVVVVRPGYHLLIGIAEALGCTLREWHLDIGLGFRPSLDELASLVGPRTRMIVVNFPHNPTGASLTLAEMHTVIDLARSVGAYVLWDEAFTAITYDSPPLPPVCTLYERGISTGTFSKSFGLPGLRFGWCIAPPETLAICARTKDYGTLHVSPLVEALAAAVLEHADAFIEPRRRQADHNRELLRQWATAHESDMTLVLPVGGVAAFPRFNFLDDSEPFCEALFQDRGVLVIPGSCFGCSQHIRLGFGGATSLLAEGLDRLSTAIRTRPRAGVSR